MTKKYWRHGGTHPKAALRDFGKKHYGNPLFNAASSGTRRPDKRPRRRNENRGLALIVVAGLAMTAVVAWAGWYLLWSSAFRVTGTEISGVSSETEATIRAALDERLTKHRLFMLPQDNLLAFSSNRAAEDIATKVFLAELRLRKKFPHLLIVEAKENEVAVVLATKLELLALDKEGRVVRSLSEGERVRLGILPPEISASQPQDDGVVAIDTDELKTTDDGAAATDALATPAMSAEPADGQQADKVATGNGLAWPLIMIDDRSEGKTADETQPGETALPKEAVQAITDASALLPSAVGETATWYTFRPTAETVEAHFSSGWSAYLTVARPVAPQIDRLGVVLKEKVGGRLHELLYADMRFEEKIFLRFKAAPTEEGAAN